jgi:hypothetical protein
MLAGDLATAAADGRLEAHASAAWVVTAPHVRELPSQTTLAVPEAGTVGSPLAFGGVAPRCVVVGGFDPLGLR